MERTSNKMLEHVLDRAVQMVAESPVRVDEFIILCKREFLMRFGSEMRMEFSFHSFYEAEAVVNATEDVKNMVTYSFRSHGFTFHLVEVFGFSDEKEAKPVMFAVRGTATL